MDKYFLAAFLDRLKVNNPVVYIIIVVLVGALATFGAVYTASIGELHGWIVPIVAFATMVNGLIAPRTTSLLKEKNSLLPQPRDEKGKFTKKQ